ncbi:uncharacterized protein LOC135955393 [Calliphora vicina]|uniref:uncharacterized protein LOC135955393 n=1 Tax=Calliphora vicina TaxID=7373 RepID=UPI00325B7E49
MDELLWTLHFKDILLIYQGAKQNFHYIFELCWIHGFISVLLWSDKQLYTYHPYPEIKVVQLNNVTEFQNKTHLHNFQGYEMVVPDITFPPVCFSYHNKQGKLLRVGYFYKWIEIFLRYHNATIRHEFYDMWQSKASLAIVNKFLEKSKFSFVPAELPRSNDYASSLTLIVTKIQLIVPSSNEIANNLYLLKPFNMHLWLYIILCGLLFLMLIVSINVLFDKQFNVAQALLQTIKIILFLAVSLKTQRSLLSYYLCLLILFTGLFLTNFYSSSLSSLLTSKVYEPELQQLEDIKRNNLLVFEHTADGHTTQKLNIPKYLKQRFYSGNNSEFKIKRQSLDMSYMYMGQEDLVDFILSQQQFMKKPKAIKLKEPLKYKQFFITLPHRSPVIDQFNRYLLYMSENGILKKIMRDTNWHGVLSGNLKILMDDEVEKSLTIKHFQYAFLMWICGLMCAIM